SIGNELNWKRVPFSATVYQNTSPNAVRINVPKSGSETKTFVAEFYDEFGTKIFDNKTSGYDVVWSFKYGDAELGTTLTGVTADRSAGTITVTNTAQSTEKPIVVTAACGAISDSIDVNIVREESKAESIVISGQTAIFVDSAEDKEYTYTASAVDQYGLTINEPEVTWVTEPAQLPTGITLNDGTLTVSKTAAPSNVTIKLTAQADGQKSNELTINIARAQAVPSDIEIENGTKTANFSGGDDLKIPFTAVVTDQYGSTISNPTIVWSIESIDGAAVDELPTGLAIDESTGEVTLSNGVKNCTITINAAYKTLSVSHELLITIDAAKTASIRLSTNNPTATVDGVNDVEITMSSVVKDQYEAIIDNATVQYTLASETELETSGKVSITTAGVLTVNAKAPAGTVTVIAERDGVTAEKQITISRNAPVVAKAVIEGAKSITVPYDGVMTGVSEAYTFTLYDQYDDVYADQSAYSIYAASLPTDVSFSNGMLHVASSAASGEAVLRVVENGVTSVGEYTVIITREAPVVTSLAIYRNGAAVNEDSLVIPINEARSYDYRAMLLDQYGTLIDGEIEWAIEGDGITLAVSETNPTMATVNVSPTAGDSGKLTATSGALSAEVTLNLFDLQISWPTETGTGTQADPLIEFNPDAVYGARNSEVVKSLTALGRGIVDGTVYTGKFALLNPDVVQNASDSAEITISFTIDYKDEYGDYSGNVYTKTYTTKIGKRPVTAKDLVYTLPTDAVYNGKRHDITVTSNITGIGDIGMKYTSGGVAAAPVNAGEYTAIALVPEAGNYAETVVELGTFTIAPAPVRLDVSGLTISKVYDGTNAFLYERDASGKAYMNGVLSGDIIAVVINGEFSTANAGETTAILTPTLSGANYTIADESRSVTVPATILTTELIGAAAIQHIESEQIYDTIEVGDTLEIKLSGVLNDVLAYQWYRDGQAISGATAMTYKVVEEDRDTVLTAVIRSATGNCTGTITASGVKICSPIFMGSVTVVSSGEGVVGDTLNAVIDVNS
ncbi:MAG: hypothetical protein HUJ65_04680, partial [Oscillospiraceae bacterium]|nr:hypothetical protein [Oscillospiraceae bacterium]